MILGIILLISAAACLVQSIVILRRPEVFLRRSAARRYDPTWDEQRVQRALRRNGVVGVVIGAVVALLAIAKIVGG